MPDTVRQWIARQDNGELPLKFGRLKAGSKLIDAGTPITDFKTVDAHKAAYEYADNAPQNWSVTLNIPYVGKAPDYGPYEYGGDDNAYTLKMPVNDGTVEDAIPEPSDGKNWVTTTVVNNYLFQDEVIADEVKKYITGGTAEGVKPRYYGKSSDGKSSVTYVDETTVRGKKYSATYGAYRIPKTTNVEFTLPSLAEMKSNVYCTGGRTLVIDWHYADNSNSGTASVSLSEGVALVDVKAKVGKIEKKPVVVTLTNNGGGDMYLTDLTLGVYQEVDEDGNPIVTGIEQVEKESATKTYQMYQTTNGLIVYGDIASLNIFSADGKKVAGSTDSQFVNTSALVKGMYIVLIKGKDGSTVAQKFLRR